MNIAGAVNDKLANRFTCFDGNPDQTADSPGSYFAREGHTQSIY